MGNNPAKMHLMISSVASEGEETMAIYKGAVRKYNFRDIQTMQDAMRNSSPSLISMRKEVVKRGEDPEIVDRILQLMISQTARSFNITRNIEPKQIQVLVEDLQSEYYYLKLSEVFFVLKQARLGRVRKTFERIDQPTIMSWFDEYVENKFNTAEEESMQKHEGYTHTEKDRKYDGYISKLHRDQQNTEQKRIMNIAYGMAKKMTAANEVLRSQPSQIMPDQPSNQSETNNEDKK